MSSELIIQGFMEEYRYRLDRKTIESYQRAVNQLLSYTEKTVEVITRKDIKEWLKHLTNKGEQPNTIYTKIMGVKQFYRYCWEEGITSKDPAKILALPYIEQKVPHYLTREQLQQLRKHVEGKIEERALIEVLYATGMRISELAALEKGDIHWDERMLFIPNGKGKKERFVLFTHECAAHLKAHLNDRIDDHPFVFLNTKKNNTICIRTIQLKFKSYSKKLEFRITPHTLRHTFSAHLAQKGMKLECIQELLGHDSPQQTRLYARLYDHARKEMYDEWM